LSSVCHASGIWLAASASLRTHSLCGDTIRSSCVTGNCRTSAVRISINLFFFPEIMLFALIIRDVFQMTKNIDLSALQKGIMGLGRSFAVSNAPKHTYI